MAAESKKFPKKSGASGAEQPSSPAPVVLGEELVAQAPSASRKRGQFEDWERRSGHPSIVVAGVDEVGRGCLAGPVVAAAVVLPAAWSLEDHPWISEINDSKALTEPRREKLAPLIRAWAKSWATGEASVEEIDRINIFHASHLAMRRAIESLRIVPGHLLIDGNALPKALPCAATAVVKGDLRSLSIAAASILAKVHRDRYMVEQEDLYPGYGFAAHKGYGTPVHLKALRSLGVTNLHRRSFAPVAELIGDSQGKLPLPATSKGS